MNRHDDFSQPILPGSAATDYERYLRTDELLSLQKTPEEMVHRDELLFQTVHQSSELWLKLACADIDRATALLNEGDLLAALRLLRRAPRCIEIVTDQLHMIEQMAPWDYHAFRGALGHGSGFDSPGFRHVASSSPALGHAFFERLAAAGLPVVDLYVRSREFELLYQVAEQLVEWDERVALWKYHHFKMVERMIGGHVIGTQGQPVELLSARLGLHFYPQLWEARDRLTELAKDSPE